MLQMNVAQLLKEPIGSTREMDVNDAIDIAGPDSEVEGTVKLIRTDTGILAQGRVQAKIELTCGRCLGVSRHRLTLGIEGEYFPTTDVVTGAPQAAPEEPGAFVIDRDHELDLTEAIGQYAALAMPMKPLCRPDCAGLCPTCGGNLNLGDCGCPPEPPDRRWAALSKLVTAKNEEES